MGGKQSTTAQIKSAQLTCDEKSHQYNILYTILINIPSSTNDSTSTDKSYTIYKTQSEFIKLENDLKRIFGDGVVSSYATQLQASPSITGNELLHNEHSYQTWLNTILHNQSISNTHQLKEFLAEPSSMEYDSADDDTDDTIDSTSGKPIMKSSTINLHTVQSTNNLSDIDLSRHNIAENVSNTLRDFTLLKVIGKGSFGKVMLVRQNQSQHIYAMKVLYKDQVIKRNQVDHTRTERSVMGYVRHPFIVRLRYAFQSSRKLYLVMDYFAGGELFFHLGRAGRFSEGRAKFYAAQIICALEYLHSKNVVYRDLKPENVLLDSSGYIALTDFGLSKENISDNSSAHSFCGTPEYLAPEILTRSGHGRAADWWSLGALLFEMLTGMPPFYSRNRDRLFQKILKAELKFPRFLSSEARNLLESLLDRNSDSRLGSGGDAEQVKSHAWFDGLDWDLLLQKKITAPFKPNINLPTDTGNFDSEFTNLPLDSVGGSVSHNYMVQQHDTQQSHSHQMKTVDSFAGFSFVNNESYIETNTFMNKIDKTNNDNTSNQTNEQPSNRQSSVNSIDTTSSIQQPMELDHLHKHVASMSIHQDDAGGSELNEH